MIDWVKRLFKTEPVQRTFCYCPKCNNELCGSKSYIGPDWKDKSIETYNCSKCGYYSKWHFDAPIPILITAHEHEDVHGKA